MRGSSWAMGLVLVVALVACSGAPERAATPDGDRPVVPSTGPVPTATTPPDTTLPATTLPAPAADIHEAPRPLNVPDTSVEWFHHTAPNATSVLFGVVRTAVPRANPPPAIVLVPGSDGFSTDYVDLGRELAARGFDVGFGCWWANLPFPEYSDTSVPIPCPDAPAFKGVVDGAVPDVDALVEGVWHALGSPPQVAVLGFSRGGGIVALRAAHGRPEPVVVVAGMVEGWSNLGNVPGEVDVVARAAGIGAPVLLVHGVDDAAVPIVQAQRLESALRALGRDVETDYHDGVGHGLVTVPEVRAAILDRTAAFVCARFACPGP